MDLAKLRKGDVIEIESNKYEVIKIIKESWYDRTKDKIIDYLEFELHELSNENILPNATIKWWHTTTKEIFFTRNSKFTKESVKLLKKTAKNT